MFAELFIESLAKDKRLEILRNFFNEPDMSESLLSRIATATLINSSFFKDFIKDEYPKEFALIDSSVKAKPSSK